MNSRKTLGQHTGDSPRSPAISKNICLLSDAAWELPADWTAALAPVGAGDQLRAIERLVAEERRGHAIFPPADQVLNAFRLTRWNDLRVVVLGQDPYHALGQAHGLAFSVPPDVAPPPSLRNIFRELQADLGPPPPQSGCLERWARQGVLLLNATLTVREGQPNSHLKLGWLAFTDDILRQISAAKDHCVFMLWGSYAQQKGKLLDKRHTVISSAHPSPLSAHRGFFGSRVFSRCNAALVQHGQRPVDWAVPA